MCDFVIVKDTLDSYKKGIDLINGILIADNFYFVILFNKINNCFKVKSVPKRNFVTPINWFINEK